MQPVVVCFFVCLFRKVSILVFRAMVTLWTPYLNSMEQRDMVGVQPEGQMEYTANAFASVHVAKSMEVEVNCHGLASLILLVTYWRWNASSIIIPKISNRSERRTGSVWLPLTDETILLPGIAYWFLTGITLIGLLLCGVWEYLHDSDSCCMYRVGDRRLLKNTYGRLLCQK